MTKLVSWIDDDSDVINATMIPLKKNGFEVTTYRSYVEAITNIDQIRQSDLILLDLILPKPADATNDDEFLGFTLLRELRESFEVHMPIIVLSVLAGDKSIANELERFGVAPLPKPVYRSRLLREVERALSLPTNSLEM